MTPRWTLTNQSTRRGLAYDPWEHAHGLGLRVLDRPIRTANELWLPQHHVIVIKAGMRVTHQRAALTHALGHVLLNHEDDRPKHEHQADRFAASQLIAPAELEAAVEWCTDDAQLCAELGVTRRLLEVYVREAG